MPFGLAVVAALRLTGLVLSPVERHVGRKAGLYTRTHEAVESSYDCHA